MSNRVFSPFPILKTRRLVLRQLVDTDVHEIFALRSNESVNKYLDRRPAQSLEDATSFIQAINESVKKNDSAYWAISLNDKLIGTVCLFDFSSDNTKAEMGFELLPACQGKGFMQEAVTAVLDYAFQQIQLHSIEAYTHAENLNSIRLLEKLHFKKQLLPENNPGENMIAFKLSINTSASVKDEQ